MDKKYQIFVSSTFLDLKEERQAVSRSILDLGHIPSGMEMFPATNASQLDYIKKVIDDCDYYVLIIGGRYGSVTEEGISYTEQEFDYAVSKEIPIIAFIHHDAGELKSKNVDADKEQRKRLSEFKSKVQSARVVKNWREEADLAASVITSLTSEFSENPKLGWRRDNGAVSAESLQEIKNLNDRLEYWLQSSQKCQNKLKGYENLSGSEVEIRYRDQGGPRTAEFSGAEIIREFAVALNRGTNSEEIQLGLFRLVEHTKNAEITEIDLASIYNVELFFEVFEIAEYIEIDTLRICENKKYLLQAAFMPLKKVIDDEIPF